MKYLLGVFFAVLSSASIALSPLPPKQAATKSVSPDFDTDAAVSREQVLEQLLDLDKYPDFQTIQRFFSKHDDLTIANVLLERLEIETDNPKVGDLIDFCEEGPSSVIERGLSVLVYTSNLYPEEFKHLKQQLFNHNIDYIAFSARLAAVQFDNDKSLIEKVSKRCTDFFAQQITPFMNALYSMNCKGLTEKQLIISLQNDNARKAKRMIRLLKCFDKESAKRIVVDFIEANWPKGGYFVFSDMRDLTKENSREFEQAGRLWFKLFKWLTQNEAHEPMLNWTKRAVGDLKFVLEAFLLMAGHEERVASFKKSYCVLNDDKVISEINTILGRFNENC